MSKLSHFKHFNKRQSSSPAQNPGCINGAFYKSPKSGDNIDTSQEIHIEWDTSLDCFSAQGVDIYLYAPYSAQPMTHAWGGVSYSSGSFKAPLAGSWWNSSTAPIQLQLRFVESGTPIFMSPVAVGPMFTSTFNTTDFALKNPTGASNSTSTASAASGGGIFQTIGNAWKNAGLPKGSIAAAVLVPLLAVAVGIVIYVKFQRAKEAERRKRWSQAVDKRMSAISTEWKGLPPGAQSEAIRQSIAIMRDSRASMARMSQLYDARPVSAVADGGQAGVGVGGGVRKAPGVGLRHPGASNADYAARLSQRKSTVSFAASTKFDKPSTDMPKPRPSGDRTRPSVETQRGRASRAFHTAIGTNDIPENAVMDEIMSPRQVGGPTLLGDRDIRPLELNADASVMPALAMMHQNQTDDGDFLMLDHSPINPSNLSPITPPSAAHLSPPAATPFTVTTPPSPAYGSHTHVNTPPHTPRSNNPFEGFTRGPSNMMSPDAMLAAYASGSAPGTPMTVVHPPSPHAPTHMYPALDAPAQPAPVPRGDLAPGPPPQLAGRTLYKPGGERRTVVSEMSRYSVGDEEDAYGGYGHAK